MKNDFKSLRTVHLNISVVLIVLVQITRSLVKLKCAKGCSDPPV